MSNFSRLAVRWAIAYLLLVNSVDTLTNSASANYTAIGHSWIDQLLVAAALLTSVASILFAFGWRLRDTALALAVCTGLFVLVYQEPVAILVTAGLLMLAFDAKNQISTIHYLKVSQNKPTETKSVVPISGCGGCRC
ncbi:hypothetical protein [Kaarinaea lacus]